MGIDASNNVLTKPMQCYNVTYTYMASYNGSLKALSLVSQ